VREHFWEHPDELQVKGPDVEADLGLTRDESRLLRKLVELGPFWGGSATWGDPIWQAGVPTDIEELLSITDLGGYVKERMVQTFDPNMPVDYVSRIQYSHERIAQVARNPPPRCVFISHGHSSDWYPVQAFLEKDFHIDTLEFAQEPIKGRTNLQKLSEESEKCGFAVIVMTGDDELGDKPRARENVINEIGFFQGKYGLDRVCILHEDGTNIPSNIHGLGYVSFPKGHIKAAFAELQRELRVAFPNTNPVYGAI
jgi:hypothetical protein